MKKIKHNKNSISFSFFRSISMTSILFMVLLFLGISGLFLKHSFQLEGKMLCSSSAIFPDNFNIIWMPRKIIPKLSCLMTLYRNI